MVDQKPQLFFEVKELPQILFAMAYKLSLTKRSPEISTYERQVFEVDHRVI